MDLEKKTENNKWYKSNNIRIRLIDGGDKSIVAVNFYGYNICLKLLMFDFVTRIKDELLLNVGVETIWNDQRVLTIDSNNVMELIDYIPVFVAKWDIEINESTISDGDAIPDEIWYGDPSNHRRCI